MIIVECINKSNIVVEFQDEYKHRKNTTYSNFKKGEVRNPYDRTVYGVGMVGCKYANWVYETKRHTDEYLTWNNMIQRCYSQKLKAKQPAYTDVTCCEEWLNYENFYEWYTENKYKVEGRLHLDKDILVTGNREYHPNKCLLVPQRINMLFVEKPNKYNLPNGVRPSGHNRYESQYSGKLLGYFDTLEEAIYQHDKAKQNKIHEVAEEYKNVIPLKVYEALINYKIV